jgi:hypothetical protein
MVKPMFAFKVSAHPEREMYIFFLLLGEIEVP